MKISDNEIQWLTGREGRVYNLEIQRKTTIDHARRTRRYSALVDAEYLEKGKEYNEMPEVYVIYISETDIWETQETESPVERHLKGQIDEYNDGSIPYISMRPSTTVHPKLL